jgi:hypothetical protein
VARACLCWTLVLIGVGLIVTGYIERTIIGGGTRPYAYISVIALGAVFTLAGAFMWRDR